MPQSIAQFWSSRDFDSVRSQRQAPRVKQKEIKNHDEALLRMLFEEHRGSMQAYATRLLNDRFLAEDVVQEALVRAWRHHRCEPAGQSPVRGWLLTIVRNLAIDALRSRAVRAATARHLSSFESVQRDHSDVVIDHLVTHQALGGLSPDQRTVLEHTYLRGLTPTEAAREMNIPSGTVKSRVYRAIRALRTQLADVPELEEGP